MIPQPESSTSIRNCGCCGLVQSVPLAGRKLRAVCARCGLPLGRTAHHARSNSRTAAIALAALILYPLAIGLPMLSVTQLGHHNESSILEGITALLSNGQIIVGLVVLLCSIVFPLGKLIALLVLTTGGLGLARRHQALVYRLVHWTGRWGMLDVLLVAILIAAVKLGDIMEVTPGPAALAFTICVALSLLATASFDPHALWDRDP